MTEDEAKTKWCPVGLAPVAPADPANPPVSGGRNEDGTMSDNCLCIASACMAWTGEGCGLVRLWAPAAGKH